MINFALNSTNELLLNPRLSLAEKTTLQMLQQEFEKLFGPKNYFLIPSSGSSQKTNESVKLIALLKANVLNSARRFNSYFKTGSTDHWALVLPEFHVAGVGVMARAHLAGAKVFSSVWPVPGLSQFLGENGISYMSLVPGQVHEIVRAQEKAPPGFKKIFVGAGTLNEELRLKTEKLGWTLAETYGMTETASMIAVKERDQFKLLPGVEVKIENDVLCIQCDSLLSASVQKIDELILLTNFENEPWYETQDCAELTNSRHLRFLGRKTDYIKILGEGVSLNELRAVLDKIVGSTQKFELLALEDERAGYKLVLVFEEGVSPAEAQNVLNQYNLSCRPYEKIGEVAEVGRIPRTALGKLKSDELKSIIKKSLLLKDPHG